MIIAAGDSSGEVLQCGYTWEVDDLGACIATLYSKINRSATAELAPDHDAS
jgi:hypothetical protein